MRVLAVLLLVCGLACASASMATWERLSLLQLNAEAYEPCGESHCSGSHPIPRGYQCNCEKFEEHPLCGCEKVNRADAHPGYVITSQHPLPSNKGARVGDIGLPADSDRAKEFDSPKSDPNPLPPPADNECIPNVADVTPGTCVVGNNPNTKTESTPAAKRTAPEATKTEHEKDAKEEGKPNANAQSPEKAPAPTKADNNVVAADKIATAAVAATAKESLHEIEKATKELNEHKAQEEKAAKELKDEEKKLKKEATAVKGKKVEELAIEKRVVGEKQEAVIQREALKGVENKLKDLTEQVKKTLAEAQREKLTGQAAKDVEALSKGMGQQQKKAMKAEEKKH